jgi:hypothetical protein
MRDPTVNAGVEEAIEAVRSVFERHRLYLQPAPNEEQIAYVRACRSVVMGEMPEDARKFLLGMLITTPPRRRSRYIGGAYWLRDRAITEAVEYVAGRGFSPTRNDATRDNAGNESASSIVATALSRLGIDLPERRIESIWNNRPKRPG